MNFFAPAFLCDERGTGKIGLVRSARCFTLRLARVSLDAVTPIGAVFPLHLKDKVDVAGSEAGQGPEDFPGSQPLRTVGWASVLLALLQSLCTAVLTISGIRVAIGLSALAAASGIYAPAKGWHQDAIRIPMLIVATIGAAVNLAVIWWMRHLRNRPAAQWRRRERTGKEKGSERLQIVLSVATLILVGLEVWTHPMVHRVGPPPPCRIAKTC